jgi:hypothetical protein
VNEAEAFERATRRSRTIKLALLALVVLSPLIWVVYKNVAARKRIEEHREAYERSIALTDADKTELRDAIPNARKAIDDAARAFVTAVTPQTLDGLQDAGTNCPYRVSAPTMGAGESYVKYGSIDGNYFGNARYTLYAPGAAIKPSVGFELSTLDEIAKQLAEGKADKNDLERVRRLERGLDDELFVVGETKAPVVLADSYLPGSVTGFAYLYSYDEGRIVCFAALAVQSSPEIEISYSHMAGNYLDQEMKKDSAAQAVLERDLHVQVRYAIASRLHSTL